jgi:hypothetical protein
MVSPLSLFRMKNRICLSGDVQVAAAAWRDEDHDKRRPGAEDQEWAHRLDPRWSDDREVK